MNVWIDRILSRLLNTFGVYRMYARILKGQIARGSPPKHIGIILDGNRRWARFHGIPEWMGHSAGADRAEDLLDWCNDLGIRTITLYVLSGENLKRDDQEVGELIRLIESRLKNLLNDERIYRERVRVKSMGNLSLLPDSTVSILREIEERTRDFSDNFLNICIAYGGRQEIVHVVQSIAKEVRDGSLAPEGIDDRTVEEHLYTAHLPDPDTDLVIRTSGEERLSGFLLWQSAYSELVFLDVYWPDFRKIDLMRAIRVYQKRERRYGR